MRYLLAILLLLSLYLPDAINLVAYADYVVDEVSDKKVNICDCESILAKNNTADHGQHTIVIKTDWTYIVASTLEITPACKILSSSFPLYKEAGLQNGSSGIFQPPKV